LPAAARAPYLQSGDAPATDDIINQSKDGSLLIKRSETNDDIEVWDVRTNKLLASIVGLSGVVNGANISPDGSNRRTAGRASAEGGKLR